MTILCTEKRPIVQLHYRAADGSCQHLYAGDFIQLAELWDECRAKGIKIRCITNLNPGRVVWEPADDKKRKAAKKTQRA